MSILHFVCFSWDVKKYYTCEWDYYTCECKWEYYTCEWEYHTWLTLIHVIHCQIGKVLLIPVHFHSVKYSLGLFKAKNNKMLAGTNSFLPIWYCTQECTSISKNECVNPSYGCMSNKPVTACMPQSLGSSSKTQRQPHHFDNAWCTDRIAHHV